MTSLSQLTTYEDAIGAGVVTHLEGTDGADVPVAFVAVTVNVYRVRGASPVMGTVPPAAPDSVPVTFPGLDVTR